MRNVPINQAGLRDQAKEEKEPGLLLLGQRRGVSRSSSLQVITEVLATR